MKTKKLIIGALAAILIIWLVISVSKGLLDSQRDTYQETTAYSEGSYSYTCSQAIKVRKQSVVTSGVAKDTFLPVDPEEAKMLCHISAPQQAPN